MKILETERLVLRQYTSADAAFIKKLLNEPSFIKNIGNRNIETLDDAKNYIAERLTGSYEKNGYGLYMVELKDKTPIGMCGLVKRETLPSADVGFALLPDYWGKGYAIEASLGVLHYAKNKLKMKKVFGIALPGNKPSIKILEKIGLEYIETKKFPQDDALLAVYSIEF